HVVLSFADAFDEETPFLPRHRAGDEQGVCGAPDADDGRKNRLCGVRIHDEPADAPLTVSHKRLEQPRTSHNQQDEISNIHGKLRLTYCSGDGFCSLLCNDAPGVWMQHALPLAPSVSELHGCAMNNDPRRYTSLPERVPGYPPRRLSVRRHVPFPGHAADSQAVRSPKCASRRWRLAAAGRAGFTATHPTRLNGAAGGRSPAETRRSTIRGKPRFALPPPR